MSCQVQGLPTAQYCPQHPEVPGLWSHILGCSVNALLGLRAPRHLLCQGCAAGCAVWTGTGTRTRGGDYSQAETMTIRESCLHLALLWVQLSISCCNQRDCRSCSRQNNGPGLRTDGSGSGERGKSGSVAFAMQQPSTLPWLQVEHSGHPTPESRWVQIPAEPGGWRRPAAPHLVWVPMCRLSCPCCTSQRHPQLANSWGWGGWHCHPLSHHPKLVLLKKNPNPPLTIQEKSFPH